MSTAPEPRVRRMCDTCLYDTQVEVPDPEHPCGAWRRHVCTLPGEHEIDWGDDWRVQPVCSGHVAADSRSGQLEMVL